MKCTKCGAECDSRQLFCLRCGTPISSSKSEEEVIREVEVPIEDMVDIISLDEEDDDIDLIIGRDLSRVRDKKDSSTNYKLSNNDKDDIDDIKQYKNANVGHTNYQKSNMSKDDNKKKRNENNSKKKLYIGLGIGAVALVVIITVVIFTFGKSAKYDEYYMQGSNLYNKGKVQASITQFKKASEVASNNEDKIEANIMLWKACSQINGYDNELVEALKNLIKLDKNNISYYEALIIAYQGMGNQAAIDELIASVTDANMQASLLEFDGTTPVATMTEGEYDKPISVGLAAISGSTIYYTINGGNPTTSSEKYSTSIDFKEEGEYEIKAIAVDENGKESRQYKGKFILKFANVNAPSVNLDSGTYSEREKVKVKADEGCTIYYTTDQSTPTAESKVYKKGFKIPEENTVYKFIAINENGIASDVVTRIYRYEREYEYDYDKALTVLTDVLISKGIMESSFGTYEDGSVIYFEYVSIVEIEEERYYIIKATKETDMGAVISNDTYAFGCNTGTSHKAKLEDGEYKLKDIK